MVSTLEIVAQLRMSYRTLQCTEVPKDVQFCLRFDSSFCHNHPTHQYLSGWTVHYTHYCQINFGGQRKWEIVGDKRQNLAHIFQTIILTDTCGWPDVKQSDFYTLWQKLWISIKVGEIFQQLSDETLGMLVQTLILSWGLGSTPGLQAGGRGLDSLTRRHPIQHWYLQQQQKKH